MEGKDIILPHKKGIYEKYIKRPLDVVCSGAGLVVLSPVMAVFELLVRVKLGKPVIFSQERPGLNEKLFKLYKFRTMKDAVEVATGRKLSDEERLALIKEKGEAVVTSDAQRLTRLGRVLRKFSLDELPELN